VGEGSRELGNEQENVPGAMDRCHQDMGRSARHPKRRMDKAKGHPFHTPAIPSHQLPQPHQRVWQLII